MAWGHVRSPARSDLRRAGTFSPEHMTLAKSRRNQGNFERSGAARARGAATLPDVQASAPNAPDAECGRATGIGAAGRSRDAHGAHDADAVSLRDLDTRLAKHIAAFEAGAKPRAYHLAAARGLYALISDEVRKGADVRELTMVGAPHWLIYSYEQVAQHA